MASVSRDPRFLGMDLRTVWRVVRQPWVGMHRWRWLSWLTPAAEVLVLRADGSQALWRGERHRMANADTATRARFVAIEIPDELVLRRDLRIPAMDEADMRHALSLQVSTLSPFPAPDLAWGWRAGLPRDGVCDVQLALVSRSQVAEQAARRVRGTALAAVPEVWVCPDDAAPIVIAGYGEAARIASATRQRHLGYKLLACAALLALAILITPTVQLWLRATQASVEHAAVAERARPALARRDALLQSVGELQTLRSLLSDRVDPLRVLEVLTTSLPDGTALQSLRLQGDAVTISGLTANSATLMQTLSDVPGLRDVRAPTPATRIGNAANENFTIVVALDPEVLSPRAQAPADGAAADAATAASVPAAGPASAGVASPTAVSAAPPASGPRPSFGGSAGGRKP